MGSVKIEISEEARKAWILEGHDVIWVSLQGR